MSIDGRIERGTARDILVGIQRNALPDSSVRRMGLDEYTSILIHDAPYFVPSETLAYLDAQRYESSYDQALQYLAVRPSGGTQILKMDA